MVARFLILTFFLLLNCNILQSTGLIDSKKNNDDELLFALVAISVASSIPDTEISGTVRKSNGQIITQPSLDFSKGTISSNLKNQREVSSNESFNSNLSLNQNYSTNTRGTIVDSTGSFRFQIQSGDILCVVSDAGVELGRFSFRVTNTDSSSTITNRKVQGNLYLKYSSKKLGSSTTTTTETADETPTDPAETP